MTSQRQPILFQAQQQHPAPPQEVHWSSPFLFSLAVSSTLQQYREKAMVVNLEFIKAIVTAEEKRQSRIEEASPLDEQDSGMNVSTGRQWLPVPEAIKGVQCDLPFEFQVLEIALEVVCTYLNSSVADLERESYHVLDELVRNVAVLNLSRE
ncbi:hypothetical protein C1H46_000235 [Malus baccata]|uniref:Uncharacterized protein n=1 Tax=Malus baccata TaxID=106549 RepID=A0A540NTF4_MALBA|nr:hypothetical protein C1H46_000235 [Malus baccata]